MSLDTLSNVKSRLGVVGTADDALLTLLMNSADKWVVGYCDRDFGGGTYTEYHPGGSEFVHLRNYPVQSITSVKVDPAGVFGADTLLAATAYALHTERGVLQSRAGPWFSGPRAVQVVYVVASGVADDVLAAYAQLVGHWYRQVKTQVGTSFVNLASQRIGEVETTYRPEQLVGLPIPPGVRELLAPYRAPPV